MKERIRERNATGNARGDAARNAKRNAARTREGARTAEKKNGEQDEKIKIAGNMLNKGFSLEIIEEVTGVSKEDLDKLQLN